MARRKCAEVEVPALVDALSTIPAAGFKNGLLKYDDVDFKHAPRWAQMHKFRTCLLALLKASRGLNIHQVTLAKAFSQYSTDNDMDLDKMAIDGTTYRIRAMIAQLINHKSHDRTVPQSWRRYLDVVYDAVVLASESPDAPCTPAEIARQPAEHSQAVKAVQFASQAV
eukprot:9479264-Pyramimonas_sp.AAC.1